MAKQRKNKRKHTAICRKNEHWAKWVHFPVGPWEIIESNVLETHESKTLGEDVGYLRVKKWC